MTIQNSLQFRCEMTSRCVKELVGFMNVFQILPRHVSARSCHHQGVVGALEATQAMSELWTYTDYDPPSVVCCRATVNNNINNNNNKTINTYRDNIFCIKIRSYDLASSSPTISALGHNFLTST
jgi:hypothetical protein